MARSRLGEPFKSVFSEHAPQNATVPRGILGAAWRGGIKVALVNPLFYSRHSSAFICFICRTGVACQILFDSVPCSEGKFANHRFRGLTSSKNKHREKPP